MKKITKILGIGLTVALITSMVILAIPVAAAPGNMTFTNQSMPTTVSDVMAPGTDVSDFAVNGNTIFAINGLVNMNAAAAPWPVYRSTNGGNTFKERNVAVGALALPPTAIAVASDNPDVIALTDGTNIYTSNNGGNTWAILPDDAVAATQTDIAVGPARSGTLLGRDYFVTLADPTAATMALGDVITIGGTAAWTSAGATSGIVTTHDYMAVTVSTNFVGDRVIAVVGATTGGSVDLQLLNTQTTTLLALNGTTAIYTGSTIDFDLPAAVALGIASAEIAIPTDWDPTTAGGQRTYVVVANNATFTGNDAYRIDASSVRALGAVSNIGVKSVSYAGTIDEGTLFVGQSASNAVRFTSNPQTSLPTWTASKKNPGLLANTMAVIRVASDYGTTNKVFAGTTGAESAFNVSNNGGVSFEAESLIDNAAGAGNVVLINNIAITPDGSTIYMATTAGANISLWKSSLPTSSSSWTRMFVVAGTAGLVKLNPGWEEAPVVYLFDITGAISSPIYRSSNGGDIFATRAIPATFTINNAAGSSPVAIEDANTVYIGNATGNLLKSTSGAWTWSLPVSTSAGQVFSMDSPMPDHLLVGGNIPSYSTNGGSSFIPKTSGLPGGGPYNTIADDDYANNNTWYIGGSAGGAVARFVLGTSSVWDALGNPTATGVVGLSMQDGVIYAGQAAAIDRNLNPRIAPGTVAVTWDSMISGTIAAMVGMAVTAGTGNVVYGHTAGTTLFAFDDSFAGYKPVLTSPGSGSTLGIDPVTGRGDVVTLAWEPFGSGIGSANRVDIQIWETSQGTGAATSFNSVGVNASSPHVLVGPGLTQAYAFLANKEYSWRVRWDQTVVGAGAAESIRTARSDSWTIKVQGGAPVAQPHAGPVIVGPQGGATTGLTPGIAWAPLSGATMYEIILATDPGLKNTVGGTPVKVADPAWQPSADLDNATTYFFGVRMIEPSSSPQSIGTFVTMAKAVKAAPPVTIQQVPAPVINIPAAPAPAPAPASAVSGTMIWSIIIVGAVLFIAVIVLIVRTRRPM